MSDEEIWQRIVSAIREETDNPEADITRDMTASGVPGWDSLAHVRIVLSLNVRLNVAIEMKSTYNAATIGDLVAIAKAAGA